MKRPAVFFDRDNTLIVSDGYLGDPAKVILIPGAADAVARARKLGFAVVVFSNQSGVARGMFTEEDVQAVNTRLDEVLRAENAGAIIDRHEYCPFHPEGTVDVYARESDRRKPRPGMIHSAARAMALDLDRSWVVGDAARDVEAGKSAGCRAILFQDQSLSQSPAARQAPRIDPDYTAGKLSEAMDFIEKSLESPTAGPEAEASTESAAQSSGTEPATPSSAPEPASHPLAAEPASDAPAAESPARMPASAAAPASGETTPSNLAIAQAASVSLSSALDPAAAASPAASRSAAAQPTQPAHARATATVASPSTAVASPAAAVGSASTAAARQTQLARPSGFQSTASMPVNGPAASAAQPSAPRTPKVVIGSKYVAPGARPGSSPDALATRPAHEARRPEANSPSARPSDAASRSAGRQPEAATPEPPRESRVESLLEQIFLEMRRQNELHADDFSVSKLLAGIVQVIVLAVLLFAYLKRADPSAVQIHLLLATTLQTMTIALLIMSRQK